MNPTVRLWDTATGKELACFDGLKAGVWGLCFSGDGKRLAAGLGDGTILVVDTAKAFSNLISACELRDADLKARWADLAADDVTLAHRAIGLLVAASKQSVPFLKGHLKSIDVVGARKLQRWISDLGDDRFAIRRAAAKELGQVGAQAIAPIQKAFAGSLPLEAKRRLEQILNTLYDIPSPETIRAIRAIMILERVGSSEAQAVLTTLAGGAPGARETEEAKASLERLKARASKIR